MMTYIERLKFGILLYVLSMKVTQNYISFAAVNGKYCKILSIAVLVFFFYQYETPQSFVILIVVTV
jgi:hypothetical protein